MNDNKTIDITVDGAFGLLTSTISFLSPSLGIAAIAAAPALAEKLKEWLKSLVKQGKITQRECLRMTDGIDGMTETLSVFKDKETLRNDSLFKCNNDGFCDADDIFELILNQIKQDSEKKKAFYCGNFIGNIPYAYDLNYSNLIQYSRTISQLSYSEFCILRVFHISYKDKGVSFSKAEKYVKTNEDTEACELLSEILHLRNLGLLHSIPPYQLGENVGNVIISMSGIRLSELMRLNVLDVNDVNKSLGILQKMTKYMD